MGKTRKRAIRQRREAKRVARSLKSSPPEVLEVIEKTTTPKEIITPTRTPKVTVRTCSVCKEQGHTKRKCPTLQKEEEVPKKSWWRSSKEEK